MLKQISSAFQKYSFAVEKKLFVSDPQRFDPANDSGIRATVFGPSGIFNFSKVSLADLSAPLSVELEVIWSCQFLWIITSLIHNILNN